MRGHEPRVEDFGVEAILDARLDAGSTAPVALALSGGGDSLALLHLAAAWAARLGRPLLALTVDHRLHPDSGGWSARAGEMAHAVGAGWQALPWEGEKPSTGLPAAARAARHRLLAEAAHEAGARVILMAHTADDAAENALMRAGDAPGMGALREWTPSPAWPQGRGVALLRPLLAARRAALRDWLLARGLEWIDDPANADASHPRIRARLTLGQAAPAPAPTALSSALFEADRDGRVTADRAPLLAADAADALRQLAVALACASGRAAPVRGAVAKAILRSLAEEGSVRRNAGGALLEAHGERIVVTAEPPRRGAPPPPEPAWVAARLDLALGRIATEAQLAS